jgi:hypothetical protein
MNQRLIDANALEAHFTDLKDKSDSIRDKLYLDGVMAVIDVAPTIDAVQVVRCKDCKSWSYDWGYGWKCFYNGQSCGYRSPDWFCPDGERASPEVIAQNAKAYKELKR